MEAGELTPYGLHGMQPVLFVADVSATVAYYRDVLGFHADFVAGDPPVHARVVADPTYASPTVHIRFEPAASGARIAPSGYLWLHVGRGLDALCERYRGRGVRIVDEPADKPWGLRQFTIEDCNGTLLCFCAEAARDLSDVTVRRSVPQDTESFRRCLDAVARERRWLAFLEAPPLEEVAAFLRQNAPIQFVAVRGDEVVGWCDVTPNRFEGYRHSGVLGMGLLAGFRGGGLGRRLLRETIDAAGAGGISRIELAVLASNASAVALYERFGFVHEGRRRAARILDGRREDILCMARVRPADESRP